MFWVCFAASVTERLVKIDAIMTKEVLGEAIGP